MDVSNEKTNHASIRVVGTMVLIKLIEQKIKMCEERRQDTRGQKKRFTQQNDRTVRYWFTIQHVIQMYRVTSTHYF